MLEESSKAYDTNKEKVTNKSHNERIPWGQYSMAQVVLLSLCSTCTRLEVGVTPTREKRIITSGYNGAVDGDVHCIDEGCYVVGGHCLRTIHAEMNVLLQCAKLGAPTGGSEICVTHLPYLACTKVLLQAGMRGINYPHDYRNNPYAQVLIEQLGVSVHQVASDSQHFSKLQNELTGEYV